MTFTENSSVEGKMAYMENSNVESSYKMPMSPNGSKCPRDKSSLTLYIFSCSSSLFVFVNRIVTDHSLCDMFGSSKGYALLLFRRHPIAWRAYASFGDVVVLDTTYYTNKYDYVDLNEKPKLKSLWAMEKQMMEVYTKRNFILFQKEIFESTAYTINNIYEDDETIVYSVQRPNEQNSARRCRKVNFNKQSDVVSADAV
ncbi:hypothetical protein FNV43_RR03562 [Rhamnella rubrinervis]|uniref:Protein FAR1-RELATED SEQUENCE n=1 Tax=Rhamnella rubrinervis TaxID=2594499 RepID=A0A8K0MPF1_9ROSA|nr:hypothetical protein FNV43_RR03562 [Rhamnella rubrinervis]